MNKTVFICAMVVAALIFSSCPTSDSRIGSSALSITPIINQLEAAINKDINPITFTMNSSDAIGIYNVSPPLPNGLSINHSTGTISGRPIEITPSTVYKVKFTGFVESTEKELVTKLRIAVRDFAITPSTIELKAPRGKPIKELTFTKYPSEVTGSFNIQPALPEGLSIDAETGKISGTVNTTAISKVYTVSFTGSEAYADKSAIAQINIAILYGGTLSINPGVSELDALINKPIKAITFTKSPLKASGSFSVSPSLPEGLSLDKKTGTISGKPIEVNKVRKYTVKFTGTGIYATMVAESELRISVKEIVITPDTKELIATSGIPIKVITFTKTPSETTGNYEIEPSLPEGLSIDDTTGSISGTPKVTAVSRTYTVSFIGTGDYKFKDASTKIEIEVKYGGTLSITPSTKNLSVPAFSYFSITFTKSPAKATGVFSISPPLPDSLYFYEEDGKISGEPTTVTPSRTYTVSFTGSGVYEGKRAETELTIEVSGIIPSVKSLNAFIYKSIPIISFKKIPPDLSGSFGISPDLPEGLSIDPESGNISGTPKELKDKQTYKITFTKGIYSKISEDVTIGVSGIHSRVSSLNAVLNTPIPSISFTKSPSDMSGNYEVSPTLPPGLSLDPKTGSISGTPNKLKLNQTYTVRFTAKSGIHSGKTFTADLNLTIIDRSMVFVEGGSYTMGKASSNDDPAHIVEVSSFYISKYEVTQKLYKDVMGSSPSDKDKGIGNNYPVNKVSWHDAVIFCNKLSEMDGLKPVYKIEEKIVSLPNWDADGYRLPTEAEWEYAARGGKKSKGYRYSGSNTPDDVAWHRSNSGLKTHPVGRKKSNELGLYDMNGNVSEWCWDWYKTDYYDSSPKLNPKGPDFSQYRVIRGGYWKTLDSYKYLNVSARGNNEPGNQFNYIGFRVLRPIVK